MCLWLPFFKTWTFVDENYFHYFLNCTSENKKYKDRRLISEHAKPKASLMIKNMQIKQFGELVCIDTAL